MINLGGYYQDEGLLGQAYTHINHALELNYYPNNLKLRLCLLMEPVAESWPSMLGTRLQVETKLKRLIDEIYNQQENNMLIKSKLGSTLDRIHFYIVYLGVNDRYVLMHIYDFIYVISVYKHFIV